MDRPHLIGATDAATLIGLGYESQAHLFLRLRGIIQVEELDADALLAGKLAEDGVLKPLIEHRFGVTLIRATPIHLPDEPRIGCSIDFFDSEGCVTETKFTGSRARWGPPGSREVPVDHWAQVQFQLAILRACGRPALGSKLCPCFIPGFEIVRYPIDEDREVGDRLLASARDMLRRVDRDDPPDPKLEAESRALILARRGVMHVVTDSEREALVEINRLQGVAREAEAQAKALRDTVCPGFGDATELVTDGGEVIATYRSNREFDAEAFALAHPDLVLDYMTQKLDIARLKKEQRKLCDQFMCEPVAAHEQTRVLRFSKGAS